MADMDINISAQIRELQSQLAELRDSVKEKRAQAADTVRDTASAAVDYTKSEATRAIDLARDNPTTTAVSLLTIGILGGLIGYAVGLSVLQSSSHNKYWR